jgi:hypothetical protein
MKAILIATAALAALGALMPQAALAQSQRQKQQDDKNLMRNLGVGLGVAALDRLRKGDKDAALALGAAALYAGKKYEDQRKSQNDRFGDRRWDDRRDSRFDRDDYSRNDRDDQFSRNDRDDRFRLDRDDHSRFDRDDRWSRDRDDDDCRRDNGRRPSVSKSRYSRDRDDRGRR